MRPLTLELQGFTAFRDHQDVPLEGLDLFVITGPTGAGKSSLLDAMMYALFGKVPRMGSQGLSDLVSHGLPEARIRLDFAVGDTRYRVARRLRRRGASSATFERFDGHQWRADVEGGGVRAVDRRVEQLVKLDFDAFTRAVVLPQGEFQRFLRGDREQRRDVLTDLLGLHHYEAMGNRARARIRELEASMQATREILDEQYADATAERLAEVQAAHKTAQERAAALADGVAKADDLERKATILVNARLALKRQAANIEDIRLALSKNLAACQQAREREDELNNDAVVAQQRNDELQAQLEEAQRDVADLVDQHGSLEDLVRAEDALQARNRCQQDLVAREQRLEALTAELASLETEAETAQADAERLRGALQIAKSEAQQAEQAAQEASDAAGEAANRRRKADDAASELREAEQDATSGARLLEKVAEENQQANLAAQTAEEAYSQLADANVAASLAQHLKAGEPCPVCHRVLDAAPDVDVHVAEALAAAKHRRDQARAKAEEANRAFAQAEAAKTAAEQRVGRAQTAVDQALAGVQSIEALQEQADIAAKAKTERLGQLDAARKNAERVGEAERDARIKAEHLTTTLSEKTSTRDTLTTERRDLRKRAADATKTLQAHFGGEIPADAEAQLTQRRKAVAVASKAVEDAQRGATDAQRQLRQATRALMDLRSELSHLDADIAGLRTRCETSRRDVVEAIAVMAYAGELPPLPTVAPTRETHVGDLSSWCDSAGETLAAADAAGGRALSDVDQQLLQMAADHGVEVLADASPAQALKAAERSARETEIRCDEAVQQAKQRLAERDKLTESIAEKQAATLVLRSLASELRADRFIQFIIQQTLDLLAVRASEQLMKISADRYSLVSHEGEFSVVDHANADEQRSVKTLSGGETFLASLSLALALSQHVGELATEDLGAKLEAVFIDEGFGTLDPDTLEDVIDALERLRESKLMIGVITHVPALAQRIRVGIRVEKDQNKSTVITATA